jgi:hypothetical protein
VTAGKLADWLKLVAAACAVVGVLGGAAMGAAQKLNAVPTLQKDVKELQLEVAEIRAERRFMVRALERVSGLKYRPRPRVAHEEPVED